MTWSELVLPALTSDGSSLTVLATLVTVLGGLVVWGVRQIVAGKLVPRRSLEDALRREAGANEVAKVERLRADLVADNVAKLAGTLDQLTRMVAQLSDALRPPRISSREDPL